ncbi:hypothetical protein EBI_26654 [Enterocytozoon bieneusi H348]|nr:hypothetical protein EBI_26654 [Enterocytozoon bieneusi H348]|eukprot:XP_002650760.1 hypothetical protein EBI_26654 [Enterocytozoon bieneusi H348]
MAPVKGGKYLGAPLSPGTFGRGVWKFFGLFWVRKIFWGPGSFIFPDPPGFFFKGPGGIPLVLPC